MFGLALALRARGCRRPTVDPELILPLVLPPLLFAAARRTSWRQFLDNRAHRLLGARPGDASRWRRAAGGVPGLPLIAAIALGARWRADPCRHRGRPQAAPAPPVAGHSGRRGLSNDATSLVLYEVAVASTDRGRVRCRGMPARRSGRRS